MANKTLNLTDALYHYLLSVSLHEASALKKLREVTSRLPGSEMQIAPEQGQFMALLMELIGAQKTLDIGTFTGYSAAVVAQALPVEGKVITCDIDERTAGIARDCWKDLGVDSKIEFRLGPAFDTLKELIAKQEIFDFAFIDADKINYEAYFESCLKLLRPGGLLMIDNTLWGGDVINPAIQDNSTKAIRALNEKLFRDKRVTISLLPLADGVTLARKR